MNRVFLQLSIATGAKMANLEVQEKVSVQHGTQFQSEAARWPQRLSGLDGAANVNDHSTDDSTDGLKTSCVQSAESLTLTAPATTSRRTPEQAGLRA